MVNEQLGNYIGAISDVQSASFDFLTPSSSPLLSQVTYIQNSQEDTEEAVVTL